MHFAICMFIALFTSGVAAAQSTTGPFESAQSESRRLLDAGAQYYHQDEIDKSLDAYERAIFLLANQQRLEEAFGASMTMGAIEREAGRYVGAAERYRRLALNNPDHPRAAEAHRLAILSVADAVREALLSERPILADAYETLLDEHLVHWANEPTADNARLWRGQLLASRREWDLAREAMEGIDSASPDFPAAVAVIADSYRSELEALSSDSLSAVQEERAALVAAATKQLLPVITGSENRWPESWSDVQRDSAIAIARMHLELSTEPSPYAERLLSEALGSLPTGTPAAPRDASTIEWESSARPLLVVALVRVGQFDEARTHVQKLTGSSPLPLLDALRMIDDTIERLPAEQPGERLGAAETARLIIRLLDAESDELDDSARAALARYRANAAIAAGDQSAAVAEYAELAESSPENLPLQIEYAELLSDSRAREDLRTALVQWQTIEDRTKSGSSEWQHARRARIDLFRRLGERGEADKLARLTELLYPGWNDREPSQRP